MNNPFKGIPRTHRFNLSLADGEIESVATCQVREDSELVAFETFGLIHAIHSTVYREWRIGLVRKWSNDTRGLFLNEADTILLSYPGNRPDSIVQPMELGISIETIRAEVALMKNQYERQKNKEK
jgi:hypothetical protein